MSLFVKRIREPSDPQDGYRVLISRAWPQGLPRAQAALDLWLKELAPTRRLRRRVGLRPDQWPAFCHLYAAELDKRAAYWRPLAMHAARHPVTLLHVSDSDEYNAAVALRQYLQAYLQAHGPG